MDELEVTTLAMLANVEDNPVTVATTATLLANNHDLTALNNINNNNLTFISEEDELKLLNFPSKQEDLSTAIPLTVIFALLLVTGCIGNMCTAIVIARPKNKYMHTATNYYLFSLAMSDFLFLILGLPQEMYTLWQRYPYAFGESFCIIRGYLSEASTYASILTISAFTIERYVAICHPLWAHTMSQLPRAITSIVIIWILSAICAIPPAAELGIVTQKGPVTNRTLEQSAQCATKRTIYENMFVVSAIVFFIVPMIIVTVLYILIAIELRRSSKMNNAISKQTSSHMKQQQQLHQSNHHHHHHHHHLHLHNQNSNKQEHTSSNLNLHLHQHYHHHQHDQNRARSNSKLNITTNDSSNQHLFDSQSALMHSGGAKLAAIEHSSKLKGEGQQKFTCTISAESSLGLNETQEMGEVKAGGLKCAGSLMADIMSQRPSSAIGTERGQDYHSLASPDVKDLGMAHKKLSDGYEKEAQLGSLLGGIAGSLARLQPSIGKSQLSSLWPLLWPSQAKQPPVSACHCYLATRPHLQQSLSQQCPGSQLTANMGSVDSTTVSQHSPLSYHESLIHHHQHQGSNQLVRPINGNHFLAPDAANALGHNHQARVLHQQTKLLNHQLSLSNSPTYLSHLAGSPLSLQHSNLSQQNLNHHNYHHHHHHHHHHSHNHNHHHHHHHHQGHSQQPTPNQSRRSAAASSKKSVIRMLVAVVVSFFICWVPFHAQRLLASYLFKDENQNQALLDIYLKLTYISGVMYYLSSTINPLLYQLMSAKFRLAFKETFKCSLFRCATLLRSNGTGNSPTNSVKEAHHHNQGGTSLGNTYYCSQSSSQHNQLQRSQLTHLDSKLSKTSALDLNTGCLGGAGCCCCCCGGGGDNQTTRSAIWDPHSSSGATQSSRMARFKTRLNTSLSSLFRSNNQNTGTCPCCTLNVQAASAISRSVNSKQATAASGKRANNRLGDSIDQCGGVKHSTSCATTPLLLGNQIGDTPNDHQVAPSNQMVNAKSMSPSNFSAHSMLKFIRSSTPMQSNNTNQTSLTRLSSREEDEQQQVNQASLDQNHDTFPSSSSPDDRMDLLIRATKEQEDPLGQSSRTSGESGNSTAGSSPDQAQLTDCSRDQTEFRGTPVSMGKSSTPTNRNHRQKVSSCSSNGSNNATKQDYITRVDNADDTSSCNKVKSHRRRRSSFQPSSGLTGSYYLAQNNRHGSNQRRESSSSSNNNRHLSSSLSSSERQLEKKFSISTTTSAIDCGSYTTTNSQLTGNGAASAGGSNPALTLQTGYLSREPSSLAIEEDPITAIDKSCSFGARDMNSKDFCPSSDFF